MAALNYYRQQFYIKPLYPLINTDRCSLARSLSLLSAFIWPRSSRNTLLLSPAFMSQTLWGQGVILLRGCVCGHTPLADGVEQLSCGQVTLAAGAATVGVDTAAAGVL